MDRMLHKEDRTLDRYMQAAATARLLFELCEILDEDVTQLLGKTKAHAMTDTVYLLQSDLVWEMREKLVQDFPSLAWEEQRMFAGPLYADAPSVRDIDLKVIEKAHELINDIFSGKRWHNSDEGKN